MRRFITSFPGRLTSQVLVAALLLPFLTLGLYSRADAQLTQLPTWAVLEFVNKSSKGGAEFGKTAAEAVHNELAKTGRYDPVPQENIQRSMADLGQVPPLTRGTDILRLGQEVRATTVVTGEVIEWRIVPQGSGKYAEVILRVVATDVASGLAVNGALQSGASTTRSGDVPDETLVNEAISAAANRVVSIIQSQTLPTATVLNTVNDRALINQGTRTGFKSGQEVIVTRGREQVSTAVVTDVEPDSATVRITRFIKGIQPGDRVRAVFQVPTVPTGGSPFSPTGEARQNKPRSTRNNANFTSLLIVLGIAAVLFGGGGGQNRGIISEVNAEALLFPDSSGEPAVRVSWTPGLFAKAPQNRVQWQIWRSDIVDAPVLVTSGDQISAIDTSTARDVSFREDLEIGGTVCEQGTTSSRQDVPGVTPGRPYTYQVSLVYQVNAIDLPDATSGATAGTASTGGLATGGGTGLTTGGGTTGLTTGGGTTGLTTTGGTTATGTGTTATGTTANNTGTTAGGVCFFITVKQNARGIATPYARPQLVSPASNAVITAPTPFTFTSVVNPAFPTTVEYVVQISPSSTFPAAQTATVAKFQRTDTGTLSTPIVNTGAMFTGSSELWWRIGARNVADIPGPIRDASGQRYIFSPPRRFTRPTGPPPPP